MLGPLALCRSSVSSANTSSWSSEDGCDDAGTLTKTPSLSGYMFVMVVAQMLHGAGATPIYTLAVTYLDDSLKPKVTPLYLGERFILTTSNVASLQVGPRHPVLCRFGNIRQVSLPVWHSRLFLYPYLPSPC